MILSKKDINRINRAFEKAKRLHNAAQSAAEDLTLAITETTGVSGMIDYLPGDGFGFTPTSNNDTHISIELLIEEAISGRDITEDFILDNLSY